MKSLKMLCTALCLAMCQSAFASNLLPFSQINVVDVRQGDVLNNEFIVINTKSYRLV